MDSFRIEIRWEILSTREGRGRKKERGEGKREEEKENDSVIPFIAIRLLHANTPRFDSIRFDSIFSFVSYIQFRKKLGKRRERRRGREEIESNRVCKREFVRC